MTWNTFSAYLVDINTVSTFVRLLLAMICGGVIGIEREQKNRPAGFRTYMLVCLGAAFRTGKHCHADYTTAPTKGKTRRCVESVKTESRTVLRGRNLER